MTTREKDKSHNPFIYLKDDDFFKLLEKRLLKEPEERARKIHVIAKRLKDELRDYSFWCVYCQGYRIRNFEEEVDKMNKFILSD